MTENRPPYTPPCGCCPPVTSLPAFNEAATDVSEVEIKFLVPELPRSPDNLQKPRIDTTVFPRVKNFFSSLGWIRIENENNPLMTRQLDTQDRTLLQKGVTVRIRGSCEDSNLNKMGRPDICVKLGKTEDESGALRRGEYEARTKDFQHAPLKTLLQEYPQSQHPELHQALDGVKTKDLHEFFRIDCIRNRYVIDIPEEVSGTPGKRCVAELIMDEVCYVLDIPGMKAPLVFHHDLEIECERLSKPCIYDTHPDAKNHYSSPMTGTETDRAMTAIRQKIQEAASGTLVHNTASKAERGFSNLDLALQELGDIIDLNDQPASHRGQIQHAYTLNKGIANDNAKLHHNLSQDLGEYIRNRRLPIARFGFVR